MGIRGFISNVDWNQFYFRPTARYRFNPILSIAGGPALFSTFNIDNLNVYEFRLTEDLNITGPKFKPLFLFYRIRLEQRWFFYEGGGNSHKWRGRILIGVQSKDLKLFTQKRSFYFQGMWEGFQNLGNENALEFFINQTRTHFAFGHRLNKRMRYELHYIWQGSRLFSDSGIQTTQHIIRFRFFHRVGKMDQ